MTISDGTNTVTVVDEGPNDFAAGTPGFLVYVGTIGTWSITVDSVFSKPAAGTAAAPMIDVSTNSTSSGAGTLTIQFSDTDFGPTNASLNVGASGLLGGGASVTYTALLSASNTQFTGTQLAPPLTFTTTPIVGNAPIMINQASPYALTEIIKIDHTTAGQTSGDFTIFTQSVNPPQTVVGSIGNYVWKDTNLNGLQDADEQGIPNVTVRLKKGADVYDTQTTDSTGHYLFSNLPLDTYIVEYDASTLPGGLMPTFDNVGDDRTIDSNLNNFSVTLTEAVKDDLTVDFGFIPTRPGSIGDYVWYDLDGDGKQDGNEPGIPGITLELYDSTGTTKVAPDQVTDSTGYYLFTGLPAGTYVVKAPTSFVGMDGYYYQATTPTAPGTTFANDSNVNPATGITLPTADHSWSDVTIDFGYHAYPQGQIGNFVWNDKNHNGIQDSGEPGINNVTVTLLSSADAVLATQVTSGNGAYLFTGLQAGTYKVRVETDLSVSPGLTNFSPTVVGADSSVSNNDTDSNPTPSTVTLTTNISSRLDLDFGYYIPPLTVSCPPGTAGTKGLPYSSTVPASGGVKPYTFALASGTLPPGLVLNPSTGAITGTPTASGTFGFTVKVTDAAGQTAVADGVACCGGAGTTKTWLFNSPTGTLGTSQIYSVGGIPLTAYGFSNSGTPKKLYGKNGSGEGYDGLGIYGTSSANEIDSNNFVQLDLTALIAAGATGVTMQVNGVDYGDSYNIYGSNTLGSIGTLLGAANRTLEGTFFTMPGYPTYKYISVRAVSTCGGDVLLGGVCATIPQACSITVINLPPLTLTCPANVGTIGTAYSSTAVATGGLQPYTFAIASGMLPPGLTLNPDTGAITGTPTSAGAFYFSLRVTDATGASVTTSSSTCCSSAVASMKWNFNNPTGVLGSSSTYTTNGLSVTAYGFNNNGTGRALYGKNPGGSGNGLGIAGCSNNEIDTATFVQVDLSNLINANATGATMFVNSVDCGECYRVYGSNTLGSIGTLLGSSSRTSENTYFSIPSYPTYRYISVRACNGGVLFGGIAANICDACVITVAPAPVTGKIGDFVWKDTDGDGKQESGEPGINGVTVKLYNSSNTLVSTKVTANNGAYLFTGLGAGTYKVVIDMTASATALNGLVATGASAPGTTTLNDSSNSPVTVPLATDSSVDLSIDFGFKPKTKCQPYFTCKPEGWSCAPATTNNCGNFVRDNWCRVYPNGVQVGGTKCYTVTDHDSLRKFLPCTGSAAKLYQCYVNPPCNLGDLAAQVCALRLAVDFSNSCVTAPGLANATCKSGLGYGLTVGQVLCLAEGYLGGAPLPPYVSYSDISYVCKQINENYENGCDLGRLNP